MSGQPIFLPHPLIDGFVVRERKFMGRIEMDRMYAMLRNPELGNDALPGILGQRQDGVCLQRGRLVGRLAPLQRVLVKKLRVKFMLNVRDVDHARDGSIDRIQHQERAEPQIERKRANPGVELLMRVYVLVHHHFWIFGWLGKVW